MAELSRRDLLSVLASLGIALPLGREAFAADGVAAAAAGGPLIRLAEPGP